MAGISVAMEEFDGIFRAGHQTVIDLAGGKDGAHRNCAVGEALGGRHEIRDNAEIINRERRTETAEAGDDFIENEQDAVFVCRGADALQIALWRQDDASRTGHGFNDDGGDLFSAMQLYEAFQIVGQFDAVCRQALGEGVLFDIERMTQVIGGDLREDTAVVDEAADGNAAKADAVIPLLAAQNHGAGALADGALIGNG